MLKKYTIADAYDVLCWLLLNYREVACNCNLSGKHAKDCPASSKSTAQYTRALERIEAIVRTGE